MKLAAALLLFLAPITSGIGKEIFVARAVPALTTDETVWRVEDARHGLVVRLSHLGKQFSAHLTNTDSRALRARVAGLQLSRADITALREREIRKDGMIVFPPFDGVTYHFTIRGSELIETHNPFFDLEYQRDREETARLRAVVDLLPELTRIAKKERSVPNR